MKDKHEVDPDNLPGNTDSKKQQQKPDPRKQPSPGYAEKNPPNKHRTEK